MQVAVTYIPAPSFILFCQLASCAAYVKLSSMAGFITAEGLEWGKSKKFALIVFGFIGTLFANVTSLRVCFLGLFVLRACTGWCAPAVLHCLMHSPSERFRSTCQWTPSSASVPPARWSSVSSSTSIWGASCPPCAPGPRSLVQHPPCLLVSMAHSLVSHGSL